MSDEELQESIRGWLRSRVSAGEVEALTRSIFSTSCEAVKPFSRHAEAKSEIDASQSPGSMSSSPSMYSQHDLLHACETGNVSKVRELLRGSEMSVESTDLVS